MEAQHRDAKTDGSNTGNIEDEKAINVETIVSSYQKPAASFHVPITSLNDGRVEASRLKQLCSSDLQQNIARYDGTFLIRSHCRRYKHKTNTKWYKNVREFMPDPLGKRRNGAVLKHRVHDVDERSNLVSVAVRELRRKSFAITIV